MSRVDDAGRNPVATARIATACDSVVAVGAATATGATVFAKNSDRMPAGECQPLLQIAAADHASGSAVGCQYVEIDQVDHTHALVLSSPYWMWGGEHGVNEHAVAVGNHSIFTRDPVPARGLLGMDLVRLALERGTSAAGAVDVIVELVERHGQGGSGYVDQDWGYHSSFTVADPRRAFLLEASGRNWALREVADVASGTNHTTITTDWSRLSDDCVAHAVEQGWCHGGDRSRFDFAAAYRDVSVVPALVSSGRYRASCAGLDAGRGTLDGERFKRLMRDHFEAGDVFRPGIEPDDDRYFCICRHDALGPTTASMVAELTDPGHSPQLVWVALCNPCIGPYLPVFPAGRVPAALQRGGAEPSPDSAWWAFKGLLDQVERDYERNGPRVREHWREYENGLVRRTAEVVGAAVGDPPGQRGRRLSGFMDETCREALGQVDELTGRLRGG